MVKQLIIHLGDRKTGSTAIQETLIMHKAKLPGATDVFYPTRINHIHLADAIYMPSKVSDRDRVYRDVSKKLAQSDAEFGILSAETFESADPRVLKSLIDQYLPQYTDTVRLISYVRPHIERFQSGYSEVVKIGAFVGVPARFCEKAIERRRWSYADRLSLWKDVFGTQFTARPFVRQSLKNGDVVDDFFDYAIGDADFGRAYRPTSNESMTREEIALLRRFHLQTKTHAAISKIRAPLGKEVARQLALIRNEDGGTKFLAQKRLVRDLDAGYGDDIAALDQDFWNEPLFRTSFDRSAGRAPATAVGVQAKEIFTQETLSSINEAYVHIAQKVARAPQKALKAITTHRFERLTGGADTTLAQVDAIFSPLSQISLKEKQDA